MTDHRFSNLRKRLDQLGYRQPLVIEAVPLVEKLFTDLVHTTESFKKYKGKTCNIDKAVSYADVNETYRVDNARLVKENNELHLQLIKCNEEIEKLQSEMKSSVRKLEHENQDLRFLNSQYVHKVHNLEKESKLKSDQLETLQEHNLKAVVETPGGRRKNIPFRRQRMDLESTLEPSSQTSISGESVSSQPNDPYVADLLSIADKRVEELKQRVADNESEKENLEKRNKGLRKQVESRDKEINRLNDMLAGGRPVEAVLSDHKRSSGDRVVAHLNIQVDYLQQANRDLEKQIKHNEEARVDAETTIKTLEERNDELCLEIARIEKLYQHLDKEKRHSDEEVDKQLAQLKSEIEDKQQQLLDTQANGYNLKKERDELIEETERLNFLVVSAKEDKRNLVELYEKCDKDRRKLQEKNARLTVTERELVMDLERVKISKGILPKKTKSPDRVENLVRNLEEDRDYYKKECDSLLEVVQKKLLSKVPTDMKEVEASGITQILKEERDYYKKEYEILRSRSNGLHSPPTSDKIEVNHSETSRLRRERDKLQKLLGTFEKHLTQIQENVSAVTTEKNNVQLLYEQASEEIQRLRRQMARGVPPGQGSLKITSILEKAEKERDQALEELRKARQDIQNLRDDIKVVQQLQIEENRNHTQKEQDLNDCISKMEVDKGTLQLKLTDCEKSVQSLQDKLDTANDTIFSTKEELSEKESELSKMRLLLEQGDNTQNELRKRIQGTVAEVEQKDLAKKEVEQKLDARSQAIIELKTEISKLRNTVTTLDRERDTLHMQVDEKTEELVKLKVDLEEQVNIGAHLQGKVEELEKEIRNRDVDILSKQKEISGMTKQVRCMEAEVDRLSTSRDATMKENKRVQDDLAMMTEENQKIFKSLRESEDSVELLKRQVEEYTLQIARIQDMLAQKDLEKEELLLQYKELCGKSEVLESELQVKEGDAANTQQDLIQKEQELTYLQDRCAVLESEIEQHISTEESYESEISSLTKSLANIEAQLRICNEEKEHIVQDLYAVRELCVKLDQTREDLTRTVSVNKLENEKLERKLNEYEAESEYLRSQVDQERETVKSLESVITIAREKEFFEKKQLKEGIEILEKKSEVLSKAEEERNVKNVENANLRLQNLTLQEDLTSMRKQLTSEKFEKERLRQELRRTTSHSNLKGLEMTKDSGVIPSDLTTSSEKINTSFVHNSTKEPVPPSYVRPNVNLNETYNDLNLSLSEVDESTT